MYSSSQREQPYQLEFIPNTSGLDEFDVEDGETKRSDPPARALPLTEELRAFSVVEQYDLSDTSRRAPALPAEPRRTGTRAGRGARPARRLLTRLVSAVVLAAIPTGTPVGTEKRPGPVFVPPVHLTPTVRAPLAPVATSTRLTAERRGSRQAEPRGDEYGVQRPNTTPAVPEARTEPVSAPALAALRQTFASLDGPFMTFEQCEVRFAAADRAFARCLGTRTGADQTGASPPPRRVEWTLDFDRVQQRWLIVDAAAR